MLGFAFMLAVPPFLVFTLSLSNRQLTIGLYVLDRCESDIKNKNKNKFPIKSNIPKTFSLLGSQDYILPLSNLCNIQYFVENCH